MKLTFTESGGYLGLTRHVTLDTSTLPPEEGRHLETLVRTSGVLGHTSGVTPAARDALQYELTIEEGAVATTVVFDDLSKPAGAGTLLKELRKRAGGKADW